MRLRFRPSLRQALLLTTVAAGASAHAIVAASAGGVTPVDTTYNFVGRVDGFGGSGVAVGPHTFLTAGHVVGGGELGHSFTLGGLTYSLASAVAAPDILVTDTTSSHFGQMTHVDLTLVTVNGTLPGFYSIGTSVIPGSLVTMVGYGQTGSLAAGANAYSITGSDSQRHSGVNSLDARGDYYVTPGTTGLAGTGGGPNFQSYLFSGPDAAVVQGDSGGGWFQGNTLVGLSDYVLNTTRGTTNLADYGLASNNGGTPYFLSGAIDLTDPRLRTFLSGVNPVPEPSAFAALGLGALAVLRRRKK